MSDRLMWGVNEVERYGGVHRTAHVIESFTGSDVHTACGHDLEIPARDREYLDQHKPHHDTKRCGLCPWP